MNPDGKQRIYFDTTIPNFLFAKERPDRMAATWRLWEKCRVGEYEICLSPIFFLELHKCPEPKLTKMLEELDKILFSRLQTSDEAVELAAEYTRKAAFGVKSLNDSRHVAYAVVNGCDAVLSWNFHQTRPWTRNIIKEVNLLHRYESIEILQPDEFLDGGRNDSR